MNSQNSSNRNPPAVENGTSENAMFSADALRQPTIPIEITSSSFMSETDYDVVSYDQYYCTRGTFDTPYPEHLLGIGGQFDTEMEEFCPGASSSAVESLTSDSTLPETNFADVSTPFTSAIATPNAPSSEFITTSLPTPAPATTTQKLAAPPQCLEPHVLLSLGTENSPVSVYPHRRKTPRIAGDQWTAEQDTLLWRRKQDKTKNLEIAEELFDKFGVIRTPNVVSKRWAKIKNDFISEEDLNAVLTSVVPKTLELFQTQLFTLGYLDMRAGVSTTAHNNGFVGDGTRVMASKAQDKTAGLGQRRRFDVAGEADQEPPGSHVGYAER